jgi:hypothetical protein
MFLKKCPNANPNEGNASEKEDGIEQMKAEL